MLVAQSCPTLCDPMDCSPPGSCVHEIFQARILEWVATSFCRGSSQPRDRTRVSCPTRRFFTNRRSIVHGILQARILEWVAFPFSRGSSQPKDWIQVSPVAGGFFTSWATREAQEYWSVWPIPSPVDLPNPEIEPGSPALPEASLPTELWGKLSNVVWELNKFKTNPLNPVTGFLYFTILLLDGKWN